MGTVDYIKPAEDPYPAKTCASITVGATNVAEALIGQGLATVLQHDSFRAANYDDLLQAEYRAQKQAKGVHTKGNPMDHTCKVQEITSNEIASRYVSSIQRAGRVDVIPEYVSSGSRMRVHIPKEQCLATFMLAGISVPRTGFKGSADEPYSQEALAFIKEKCLQRTCQIEVLGTDKNGNMIGNLYLNGEFVTESLLRQGLGEMHFSSERYGIAPALQKAQDVAKGAKVNMWANYDPSKTVVAEGESAATSGGKQTFESVVVTEVVDALSFYAQKTANGEKLTELMAKINEAAPGPLDEEEGVRKNKLYTATFSDGAYYRVKILATVEKGKTYDVLYIDYGNQEEIDISKLGALADEHKELPAQATFCKLAVLDSPPDDYMDEATDVLRKGILDQVYNLCTEYTDDSSGVLVSMVTLINDETKDNVAMTMLSLGYARVGRTREKHLRAREDEFKKIQATAAADHQGMWMYGDISEDPKDI